MIKNKTDLYYVHLFNDFSGSPRVLRDAIEASGHCSEQLHVFTSSHDGFLSDLSGVKKTNFFYARSDKKYLQLFYFLSSQVNLFILLIFYLVVSKIKKRKSILIVNTMLPFGAGIAGKLLGIKVIYYVHETLIKPNYFKKFLRFFIEYCASSVIFVSHFLKKEESFSKPKQVVIYNGLRSDFSSINVIDDNKLRTKYLSKKILFAGSLKSYKGIYELLKIADKLKDFKFIAAMNCEPAELNVFINESKPPNNITFLARPNNIDEIFRESFLVLNLSLIDEWIETFGLTLIEGMAFGSPVVSPPVGGPVEFVTENNGFLIDSRDTNGIVQFICQLNSSFDVWKEYSIEALLTSKKFSADKYKASYVAYIKGEY
jgi:glycosyltransferase involved in cell wall biosynthesis